MQKLKETILLLTIALVLSACQSSVPLVRVVQPNKIVVPPLPPNLVKSNANYCRELLQLFSILQGDIETMCKN